MSDRIVTAERTIVVEDESLARHMHRELVASGTPHKWERWAGSRTEWNSVGEYSVPTNVVQDSNEGPPIQEALGDS